MVKSPPKGKKLLAITSGSTTTKKSTGGASNSKGTTSQPSTSNNLGESNFRIPKKTTAENTQRFQEIRLESTQFEQEIMPKLKQYARPFNSREIRNFQYTKCTLINNPILEEQFERKRKELRESKGDNTISYGFWNTFNEGEIAPLINHGQFAGNYPLGQLGKPAGGAYICQKSDVLTAAPLLDGTHGTLILCKILKGRVKLVPAHSSGGLEPTYNFDCHAPKSEGSMNRNESSPLRLFEMNLLFLYDYIDTDLSKTPRNICPVAIIEYIYRDVQNIPYWMKNEQHIWSGGIRFGDGSGDQDIRNPLRLLSCLAKIKPPFLSESLVIKRLVPIASCMEWAPVNELCSQAQGLLFNQRRDLHLFKSGRFVSVYRLVAKNKDEHTNKKFFQFVALMAKNQCVGLAPLPEGTACLVCPPSHFSCALGIPPTKDLQSCLYLVVFAYRSLVTGLDYRRDPYEPVSHLDANPIEGNMLTDLKLMDVHQEMMHKYSPYPPTMPHIVPSPPDIIANGHGSNRNNEMTLAMARNQPQHHQQQPPRQQQQLQLRRPPIMHQEQRAILAPPTAPAAIPAIAATIRDPRIHRRLMMQQEAAEMEAAAARRIDEQRREIEVIEQEREEVDVVDLTDADEVDEGVSGLGQHEPRIMPLENVDDARRRSIVKNEPEESSSSSELMNRSFINIVYGDKYRKKCQPSSDGSDESTPAMVGHPTSEQQRRSGSTNERISSGGTRASTVHQSKSTAIIPKSEPSMAKPASTAPKPTSTIPMVGRPQTITKITSCGWARPISAANSSMKSASSAAADQSSIDIKPPIPLASSTPTPIRVSQKPTTVSKPSKLGASYGASSSTSHAAPFVARKSTPTAPSTKLGASYGAKGSTPTKAPPIKTEVVKVEPESTDEAMDADDSPISILRGFVIPDENILRKENPDGVAKMLEAFRVWKKNGTANWALALHSQLVIGLGDMKNNFTATHPLNKAATDLLKLFHTYRPDKLVILLDEHECDHAKRAASEYLTCIQSMKAKDPEAEFVLLTNMSPSGANAEKFLTSDILVMNMQMLHLYLKV